MDSYFPWILILLYSISTVLEAKKAQDIGVRLFMYILKISSGSLAPFAIKQMAQPMSIIYKYDINKLAHVPPLPNTN
jgi:hypothetical protein